MFRSTELSTLTATLTAAFTLAASVLMSPDMARAQGAGSDTSSNSCTCPQGSSPRASTRPKFAELKTRLDESDEIATFQAVQAALSEVGDGGTYVWHRRNGRVSAMIQPTSSFKDPAGKVCRHIKIMLTSGTFSKTAEGIACRETDGAWRLDG